MAYKIKKETNKKKTKEYWIRKLKELNYKDKGDFKDPEWTSKELEGLYKSAKKRKKSEYKSGYFVTYFHEELRDWTTSQKSHATEKEAEKYAENKDWNVLEVFWSEY